MGRNFFKSKYGKYILLLIMLILCAIILISIAMPKKSVANADSTYNKQIASINKNEYDSTGLGTAINLVTNSSMDLTELKDGAPIFDKNWLENQIYNAVYSNVSKSRSEYFSGSTFKSISNDISNSIGYSTSVTAGTEFFKAGVSYGFEVSSQMNYKNSGLQAYNAFFGTHERYTLSLPNYAVDINQFRNNLNALYLDELNNLFGSSNRNYNAFFEKYGTHFIAKGVYGGIAYLYHGAISNQYEYGSKFQSEIKAGFEAAVGQAASGNLSTDFKASNCFGSEMKDIKEKTQIIVYGGDAFGGTSISNFSQNYSDWTKSVSTNPALIRTSNDGLIPLWEILPDQYVQYSTEMKNAYIRYANEFASSINNLYSNGYYHYIWQKSSGGERGVYNSNPSKEARDDVDVGELWQIGFNALYMQYGYKYVSVVVHMQMREAYDGYQHIYLYQNILVDSPFAQMTVEYGGTGKKPEYGEVAMIFANNNIDNIAGPYNSVNLNIGYSASGNGKNDWYFKNLVVEIILSESRINASSKYVQF